MMQMQSGQSLPTLAIVDPCCAGAYDPSDMETGGLGGTEATVLRIGAALRYSIDVAVYQNGRTESRRSGAGQLRPLQEAFAPLDVVGIVVINQWKVALKLRKLNPDTPIFLWLHVYPGRHNRKMGAALKTANVTVICVSQIHARSVADFIGAPDCPSITSIYNPIADDLQPQECRRDPNMLLFASSPHKGLAEVFQQFVAARRILPELTLAVADPGYLKCDVGTVPDGVTFLGSLSHAALISQMRRALCLFYPQTTFAETFGLVLAEANAVGTPALVSRGLGANEEILSSAEQMVDGHDTSAIVERLAEWQSRYPVIAANPAFRMTAIARAWRDLVLGSANCSRSNNPAQQAAQVG